MRRNTNAGDDYAWASYRQTLRATCVHVIRP